MGLSNNMASAYRISRALFQMTWPNRFPAKSVAYYSISSFGSQLAIVPGDSFEWIFTIPRTLSNFEQFKAMTSVSFEVCPYFYGHGAEPRQNCLASSEIVFDNKPVKLNPAVQSQVPTGVRILGYGSAKGFLYEAVQFQPTDKNLAAEWKDSFEYAGSKKIDHYDMMIGNAPFESAVDVVRGLTSTSFNTSTALEVGVAYFVTITAWDEAGIPSLLSSAPITVDATAPTG
ncbi:uncharacterized protein EV422DRAFT_160644 [Fimicolochytrium jonesii]|uniref:uncharacterized protein n=1 Tax=Fimicolochytrium jonesii TaxID=1396493 RepID=UPI0022FEA195|nr:uncharacterized protein EV422DRAFT_160644 [Fimicolochytrium jonesii]KAI8826274.1 hypothetical protein EV422DRAFT_160644 [Fimicolochytrium jonesii]